MLYFRRTFVFLMTLLILVTVIIWLRNQYSLEVISHGKIHSTNGKVRIRSVRRNNKEYTKVHTIRNTRNKAGKIMRQRIDINLLEDHELRNGELSDTEHESPDIVVKYDNTMFGLIDSDEVLHVWRAPFASIGQLWPHPWSVDSSNHVYTLCSWPGSLSFKITGADNSILQHAVRRYKDVLCQKKVSFYPSNWRQQEIFLDGAKYGAKILRKREKYNRKYDSLRFLNGILKGEATSVYVYVENGDQMWPSLYMNESYSLSVESRGVFIRARETWGALRALESVSQLAWRTRSGRVFINETRISDLPRFKHRGVMLDTGRHFLTKEVILRNIDAMEMNKMNVFHWHISDDQSFPLVTDNHPEFAKYGAYDPETKVYRPADVREIVEYARVRGIRVIPEIDSLSHSLSWRKSHPEVMTRCLNGDGLWTGYYGPLNMASDHTYRLLKSLFTDVVRLFPDHWIHLGSDEVPSSCILSNIAVRKWMHAAGIHSTDSLTDFYVRKLQNIVQEIVPLESGLRRGTIVWQEAYDRNPAVMNNTIVQIWKSMSTSEVAALARKGIAVIYSSCWYLDRMEYGPQWFTHYACHPGAGVDLEYVNSVRNSSANVDGSMEYILGGEATMWSEFFDSANVLPRIWPLACAAAERLWSPSLVRDAEMAAPRLEEMRCRMLIRSIPAGVAGGAGDCGQDYEGHIAPESRPRGANGSSVIDLSGMDTLQLVTQLLTNICGFHFYLLVLVIFLAFCLAFRGRVRSSVRRPALFVGLFLGVYYVGVLLFHDDMQL